MLYIYVCMLFRRNIDMKKRILALVGAVVLTMSMTMTAFATPSTEAGDSNITDANGKPVVNIKVVDQISDKYKDALAGFDDELVPENHVPLEDKEVVKDGEGEVDFPITIEFDKDDFAGKPVVFAFIDGAWKKLDVVDGGDTWNITVPCETVLKFFVEKAASGSETPKTGDTTSFVWFAVALAAAATAVVATKRKMA